MYATSRLEGALLERLVVARRHGSPDLPPRAAVQYHTALARLPWADAHRQVRGLFGDDGSLLATAERHVFAGALDGAPVRLCLLGAITGYEGHDDRPAALLVEQLLEEAAREGLDLAVIVGDAASPAAAGAYRVPIDDVTVRVIESSRRGAPMMPVRSGERGDVAAMAAMPPLGENVCRLRVERTADYLDFCVTRARLRAGLDGEGARQLRFFVAEEGGRAAAYVVISAVGTRWVIEACGDFDASGARVGAILQALIAAEPGERRPLIRGWWPAALTPPQVAFVSAEVSADQLWVHPLGASAGAALSAGELVLWRADLP